MWVKICANTTLEDAALAAQLGADAVGFVFAASKRQVTAPQVASITAALLPAVERIGVFDSHDAVEIAEVAALAGLSGVQLHGGYDPSLVNALRTILAKDVQIIQTLHWDIAADSGAAANRLSSELDHIAKLGVVDRVLIDSRVDGAGGGTGVSFDWSRAAQVFHDWEPKLHLILAGGLRPENVAEAIDRLHPWGVDVASGVERHVGRKDPERVGRFIQQVRSAG